MVLYGTILPEIKGLSPIEGLGSSFWSLLKCKQKAQF